MSMHLGQRRISFMVAQSGLTNQLILADVSSMTAASCKKVHDYKQVHDYKHGCSI